MKQQNLCEHHIWSEIMFNQKKKDQERRQIMFFNKSRLRGLERDLRVRA
jgi:hypothetical protein